LTGDLASIGGGIEFDKERIKIGYHFGLGADIEISWQP
jgi:hypothetical protein